MTEARDIEGIVAEWERWAGDEPGDFHDELRALIADWRAKKAEIERLRANRDKWMSAYQEVVTNLALKGLEIEGLRRDLDASEFARTHPGDWA